MFAANSLPSLSLGSIGIQITASLTVMCAVENERLSWELDQVRGMVNENEIARLRSEIDGLRQEVLHMADRHDSLEVICSSASNHLFTCHSCQCTLTSLASTPYTAASLQSKYINALTVRFSMPVLHVCTGGSSLNQSSHSSNTLGLWCWKGIYRKMLMHSLG